MATLWRALEGERDRHEESGGGPLRGNVADYRSKNGCSDTVPLAPTVPNFTILPAHAIKPAPTHINLLVGRGYADADVYSITTFSPSLSTLISL